MSSLLFSSLHLPLSLPIFYVILTGLCERLLPMQLLCCIRFAWSFRSFALRRCSSNNMFSLFQYVIDLNAQFALSAVGLLNTVLCCVLMSLISSRFLTGHSH